MTVNSFDELLALASSKETDIEKLRVLQQYFLENVEYFYFKDIGSEMAVNGEEFNDSRFKKVFNSEEEKLEEINRFERQFGENFHFPEDDRKKLLSVLGIPANVPNKFATEEKKESKNTNGKPHLKIKRANPFVYYDGSIKASIVRVDSKNPSIIEENGLIKKGVCQHFSAFAKRFCDYFSIESKRIQCDNSMHSSLIVTIDGVERVFDFTRMITIRDGYLVNNQKIDDWFNMPLEKWFELKPKMDITQIDDVHLYPKITKDNYKEYLKTEPQSKKTL